MVFKLMWSDRMRMRKMIVSSGGDNWRERIASSSMKVFDMQRHLVFP